MSSASPARSRAEIAIRRLERALVALFAEHSPEASFTCAAWRTYVADHCLALAPQQISNAALGRDAMRKITQPFALPDSCNLPAGWALWHTAKFADDWAPVQDLIIKACDLGGDIETYHDSASTSFVTDLSRTSGAEVVDVFVFRLTPPSPGTPTPFPTGTSAAYFSVDAHVLVVVATWHRWRWQHRRGLRRRRGRWHWRGRRRGGGR